MQAPAQPGLCAAASSDITHAQPGTEEEMMVEFVVRCPYCVAGKEFIPLRALADGAFVCAKCGHMTIPGKDFQCHCSKCVEMRRLNIRRRS